MIICPVCLGEPLDCDGCGGERVVPAVVAAGMHAQATQKVLAIIDEVQPELAVAAAERGRRMDVEFGL